MACAYSIAPRRDGLTGRRLGRTAPDSSYQFPQQVGNPHSRHVAKLQCISSLLKNDCLVLSRASHLAPLPLGHAPDMLFEAALLSAGSCTQGGRRSAEAFSPMKSASWASSAVAATRCSSRSFRKLSFSRLSASSMAYSASPCNQESYHLCARSSEDQCHGFVLLVASLTMPSFSSLSASTVVYKPCCPRRILSSATAYCEPHTPRQTWPQRCGFCGHPLGHKAATGQSCRFLWQYQHLSQGMLVQ